ncbi:hypothetical protein AB0L57_01040 [Nocardia sp. NPDC052254]
MFDPVGVEYAGQPCVDLLDDGIFADVHRLRMVDQVGDRVFGGTAAAVVR